MQIKVLMLGGSRCGKTSALAAMFAQVINGPVGQMLTTYDATPSQGLGYADCEADTTLIHKLHEMMEYLEYSTTATFMMDMCSPCQVNTYILGIRDNRRNLTINFTDIPGGTLRSSSCRLDEMVQDTAKESDVVVVGIDTPYLMECCKISAIGANCIREITNIIHNACSGCNDIRSAKMVIFMPVKCEKWVKENRIDEVNDRIKDLYSPLINTLSNNQYISACIIPIQTIGNIEFVEMRDAYILCDKYHGLSCMRCTILSDKIIRLEDGRCCNIRENEVVVKDLSANIPNEWYMISNQICSQDSSLYSPHNCEQILLHIIRFWTRKTMLLIPNFTLFCHLYFPIPPYTNALMVNALMPVINKHLIEDDEGIEYLQKI